VEPLERRFQDAVNALYQDARTRGGKHVARLRALIRKNGCVAAVRRVLTEPVSSDPDSALNIEALVLDPQWGCLFTDEDRALARDRLQGRL
jgi:hypothetical protein